MKILITGGAGFIGSNFIYYILDKYKNHEVFCLDKLTYAGSLSNLEKALKNKNFKFIKGDISNKKFIDILFKNNKFDLVINFAAETHVDRSINNPPIFIKTNVVGVFNLLETCKKYNNIRFHQISTDEVYGDVSLDDIDLKLNEKSNLNPSNPYSATKASADLLVKSYYRTYNLPITISRSSNNYGPYQHNEKLIPLTITSALKNKNIPIYGNGKNIRNWIHVKDHCKAIDLIINKGKIGEIYNIASVNSLENIDLVKIILKYLEKDESLIKFVKDRKGHDLRYFISSDKIKKELGWEEEIKFEDGIKNTINWYKENNIY